MYVYIYICIYIYIYILQPLWVVITVVYDSSSRYVQHVCVCIVHDTFLGTRFWNMIREVIRVNADYFTLHGTAIRTNSLLCSHPLLHPPPSPSLPSSMVRIRRDVSVKLRTTCNVLCTGFAVFNNEPLHAMLDPPCPNPLSTANPLVT